MPHTSFTRADFAAFCANDRPGPIQMLNLVRLRDQAQYEDPQIAPEGGCTGAEAYTTYGRLSAPVFARVGGQVIWRGAMEQMLIGPQDEQWDLCFIAQYDSPDSFAQMARDPEYQKAVPHRQAAVLDSRLIRLASVAGGAGFGGDT